MARRRKSLSLPSVLEFWIPLVYLLIGVMGAVTAVFGWGIDSDEVVWLECRITAPPLLIGGAILLLFLLSGLIRSVRTLFGFRTIAPRGGTLSDPSVRNLDQSPRSGAEIERP